MEEVGQGEGLSDDHVRVAVIDNHVVDFIDTPFPHELVAVEDGFARAGQKLMEGIEMFIEHLSGLTQGVFRVEIENVADTIEYEGGDLTVLELDIVSYLDCKFTWRVRAFVLWLLDEFAPL
jgi:hypothetical protein